MPEIVLRAINNFVCRDITLRVNNGELLVLLGPTGAGKTTLLNIIAGLIAYQGTVSFNGSPVDNLPARLRRVGYLFQDPALFPHLDVRSNIAYGLKIQGCSEKELSYRVNGMLHLMNITHLSHRYPKDLSGGEKQRIALARALAPSPQVLLLDEPFSSLDFRTSRYLMMELRRIQKQLGITTVYVTHNLLEAREMADRIGIICDGKLEQIGLPQDVFFEPENERVSDFLGAPNVLDCEGWRTLGDGLIEATCGGIKIVAPHEGEQVEKVVIFPAHIHVSRERPPGPALNRFKGVITEILATQFLPRFRVKVGENIFLAELSPEAFNDMGLEKGGDVFLTIKLKWIKII
ncbi:putative molybdate ABC transporter, ATP-binding protein [uncultured Desulfobacterium sp.]|uniref:Putative molybdate ABC transporter, ATP-binding protein n=1 Tax=uncultured Desulfobacterium sp. TaxID=201089 RepID=A0A445MR16_9BACT|nr:putative molybdate ABC transporter, ATP-binding protein [uncultured Desulfobacterium sp.]